ncbi:hypothetical protein ABW21_db0207911 [Orbilia brochopaga]|nr:hypothetical protein ABW21_db0207911 [Drechslerella brochopaga]
MLKSTFRSAALPLAFFTLRASAYTLWFYSGPDCSGDSVLTHTINSTLQMDSGCEAIPADVASLITHAYLALDSTDTNLNYAATLFADDTCSVAALSMPSETCAVASSGVGSFEVTSSSTTFDFGDVGYDVYGPSLPPGFFDSYSSDSNDSTVVDQVDMIAEIDSTGDVTNVDLSGAGLPVGSTDPNDCTTVKEGLYNVDNNENGVADGVIKESTAIDELGNEQYQKIEVDFAADLAGNGAIMDGPIVASDPTTNDPWAADTGLDGTGTNGAAVPYAGAY